MKTWFIFINNLNVLGKIESHVPYIYKKNIGWTPDITPMDCAMGNNIDFDEITEEEALKIIAEIEGE